MKRKWKPSKDRLSELESFAIQYAKNSGFTTLRDSFAGSALAVGALAGHLMLFDDKLTDQEWMGIVMAQKLLDTLATLKK